MKEKWKKKTMQKTIITALGKDRVGIIAEICSFLAKNSINILDISQTIVEGYFQMMMITDFSKAKNSFKEIETQFQSLSEQLGIKVQMQKEEIFDCMHRI